jgi:DNA-binding response OmpR family regulator
MKTEALGRISSFYSFYQCLNHQVICFIIIQIPSDKKATKQIQYKGEIVALTRKESDLFFYLLKKRGNIVSKEELLDALYLNPQNISSNTIDVTIGHVRKKLPLNVIKTIKTRGYTIEEA